MPATLFLRPFHSEIEKFNSGLLKSNVVFAMGLALKGHIDTERMQIFGSDEIPCLITPALQAVDFYNAQLVACKKAVDAWTMIGLRIGVFKDIRILIGKMIWNLRHLALFKVNGFVAL